MSLHEQFSLPLPWLPPIDRGSLPFEQNGPKEDIDDLRVVVRICPL